MRTLTTLTLSAALALGLAGASFAQNQPKDTTKAPSATSQKNHRKHVKKGAKKTAPAASAATPVQPK